MIALIGIKKNTPLDIRERFSKTIKNQRIALKNLKKHFLETVIINTCNRMEIYTLSEEDKKEEEICTKVFQALSYENELREYIFFQKDKKAAKHLMELSCGFHSKILGEDQILGQIRNSYNLSKEFYRVNNQLGKLFEMSLNCGKEFRNKSKLHKFPVSYASIAVTMAKKSNIRSFAIFGYGDVGKQVKKYIEKIDFNVIYIVVRKKERVEEVFKDPRIKLITFEEKAMALKEAEGIFACTGAPHYVIKLEDIDKDKSYLVFDLSLPRNIDKTLDNMKNIELYNIDEISKIDDENKKLREETMAKNKTIIKNHMEDFIAWKNAKLIVPYIKDIKIHGEKLSKDRVTSFKNKINSKPPEILAETMINSMRDFYINRGIEVLKDEITNENREEILKIIKRIFIED